VNISRKEIARRIGISPETIRRNERRLGLSSLRIQVNRRVILYPERASFRALKSHGFES
jgi:hypothetical protein